MEIPRVIYALRHNATGKVYIGSTTDLWRRINQHFSKLRNGNHPCNSMQADYEVHGDGYTVFVLDSIHDHDDLNKEALWMDALNTRNPKCGYNCNDITKAASLEGKKEFAFPVEGWKETRKLRERILTAVRAEYLPKPEFENPIELEMEELEMEE